MRNVFCDIGLELISRLPFTLKGETFTFNSSFQNMNMRPRSVVYVGMLNCGRRWLFPGCPCPPCCLPFALSACFAEEGQHGRVELIGSLPGGKMAHAW